jgi:hypothetical protein
MHIYKISQSKEFLVSKYGLDPEVAAIAEDKLKGMGKDRKKLMRMIIRKFKSGESVTAEDIAGFGVFTEASEESLDWARNMIEDVSHIKWLAAARDSGKLEEWHESGWDDQRIVDVLLIFKSRSSTPSFPSELKDIRQYSHPSEIDEAMEPFRTSEERTEEQRAEDFASGSDLIGEFSGVKLYRMNDRPSVMAACHGTSYCVRDERAFETTLYDVMPYYGFFTDGSISALFHAPTRQWRLPDDTKVTKRESFRMIDAYRWLVDNNALHFDFDGYGQEIGATGRKLSILQYYSQQEFDVNNPEDVRDIMENGRIANDAEILRRETFGSSPVEAAGRYIQYTASEKVNEMIRVIAGGNDSGYNSSISYLSSYIASHEENMDLDVYDIALDDMDIMKRCMEERISGDSKMVRGFETYSPKTISMVDMCVVKYIDKGLIEEAREGVSYGMDLLDRILIKEHVNLRISGIDQSLDPQNPKFAQLLQTVYTPDDIMSMDGLRQLMEYDKTLFAMSGAWDGIPDEWVPFVSENIDYHALVTSMEYDNANESMIREIVDSGRLDKKSVLESFCGPRTGADIKDAMRKNPWIREIFADMDFSIWDRNNREDSEFFIFNIQNQAEVIGKMPTYSIFDRTWEWAILATTPINMNKWRNYVSEVMSWQNTVAGMDWMIDVIVEWDREPHSLNSMKWLVENNQNFATAVLFVFGEQLLRQYTFSGMNLTVDDLREVSKSASSPHLDLLVKYARYTNNIPTLAKLADELQNDELTEMAYSLLAEKIKEDGWSMKGGRYYIYPVTEMGWSQFQKIPDHIKQREFGEWRFVKRGEDEPVNYTNANKIGYIQWGLAPEETAVTEEFPDTEEIDGDEYGDDEPIEVMGSWFSRGIKKEIFTRGKTR